MMCKNIRIRPLNDHRSLSVLSLQRCFPEECLSSSFEPCGMPHAARPVGIVRDSKTMPGIDLLVTYLPGLYDIGVPKCSVQRKSQTNGCD
jgi:hypothetical protein